MGRGKAKCNEEILTWCFYTCTVVSHAWLNYSWQDKPIIQEESLHSFDWPLPLRPMITTHIWGPSHLHSQWATKHWNLDTIPTEVNQYLPCQNIMGPDNHMTRLLFNFYFVLPLLLNSCAFTCFQDEMNQKTHAPKLIILQAAYPYFIL